MFGKIRSLFANNKKILIIIASVLVVALISCLTIFLLSAHKLSNTEQVALDNFNNKVLPYLEAIDTEDDPTAHPSKEEKLISFAMLYSYGEENNKELTNDQINEIVKTYFDTEIDFNSFDQINVTSYLVKQGIIYHPDESKYKLEITEKTKKELIQTPVTAYIQKEAKIKQNTITATYSKYTAKDSYEVFTKAALAGKDTTGCGNYFEGKGHINTIKRLITPENAEEVAEYKKDYILKIHVKDGKLLAEL